MFESVIFNLVYI